MGLDARSLTANGACATHLPSSIFHLPSSIFHLPSSIYHLPSPICLPASDLRLPEMPRQRGPFKFKRNVHFVNGSNDEIGGTWQNGSLTWAEMSEWMQIVFQLPLENYVPFPCLEPGDPEDPVAQHSAAINMQSNTHVIQPGFYVLLDPQGKYPRYSIYLSCLWLLTSFRFRYRHSYQSRESCAPLNYSLLVDRWCTCK